MKTRIGFGLLRNLGLMLGSSLVIQAESALAIDESSILAQYDLVGVISEDSDDGKNEGIAVLKDRLNRRTLTLKTGQYLPYTENKVHSIKRREVMIKVGEELVAITHDGSVSDTSDEADEKAESSKTFSLVSDMGLSITEEEIEERRAQAKRRIEDSLREVMESRRPLLIGDDAEGQEFAMAEDCTDSETCQLEMTEDASSAHDEVLQREQWQNEEAFEQEETNELTYESLGNGLYVE